MKQLVHALSFHLPLGEEVRLGSCWLASFSLLRVLQVFVQAAALFGADSRGAEMCWIAVVKAHEPLGC